MSVVLVGVDDARVKKLAFNLATSLKVSFVDAQETFNQAIIGTVNFPLEDMNSQLNKKEISLIKKLNAIPNAVIFIPNDMFISNKNYLELKNLFKILVEFSPNDELGRGLERFMVKFCDEKVKFSKSCANEILHLLRGKNGK